MPEAPTVPDLVALLRSTDENERDDALASLAELVDGAFGEDGEVVEVTMLRLEVLAQVTCELSVKTHPHLPMDIRASILL